MDNKSPKYFITQTLWLQFSIDSFLEKINAFYKSQNPLKKAVSTREGWGFPGGSEVKNLPINVGDMQDTWVCSLSQEDPLEEEMATHSSILAWEIPWTEDPGGLQFTGWQRIRHSWTHRHNWAQTHTHHTHTHTHTHTHAHQGRRKRVEINRLQLEKNQKTVSAINIRDVEWGEPVFVFLLGRI